MSVVADGPMPAAEWCIQVVVVVGNLMTAAE